MISHVTMYLKYFTFLLCAVIALGLAIDKKSLETSDSDLIKNIMIERCLKVADEKAFNQLWQAREDFSKCQGELVNLHTIDQELLNAKKNGNLKDFVKKYCDKKPQFDTCIDKWLQGEKKCLDKKEERVTEVYKNMTIQVGDFLCHNDGSRFVSYITDDGIECYASKLNEMQSCLNFLVDHYLPGGEPVAKYGPDSAYTPEHCASVDKMINCYVDQFKGCDKPGPADFVESFFVIARDATPCRKNQNNVNENSDNQRK